MFEIGATFRQAREHRRIDIDRVERDTKIRARYLLAIEDEDFDALPGPTFVRGFLRAYAAYLGLDGQAFVDEYNARYLDPLHDDLAFPRRRPLHVQRASKQRREQNVVMVALAGVVAVAVLVIVAATYPRGAIDRPTPIVPAGSGVTNPLAEEAQIAADRSRTAQEQADALAIAAKPVSVGLKAERGNCWVTIWDGLGTDGLELIDQQLDRGKDVQLAASGKGYTVRCEAVGTVDITVNGDTRQLTARQVYVLPSGRITTEAPDGSEGVGASPLP